MSTFILEISREDIDGAVRRGGVGDGPYDRALRRQGYPEALVTHEVWWPTPRRGDHEIAYLSPVADRRNRIFHETGVMTPHRALMERPEAGCPPRMVKPTRWMFCLDCDECLMESEWDDRRRSPRCPEHRAARRRFMAYLRRW